MNEQMEAPRFEGTSPDHEQHGTVQRYHAAYERLAEGIRENVQLYSQGEADLLARSFELTNPVHTRTGVEHGRVVATYVIDGKKPDYVIDYQTTRNAVYEELESHAVKSGDFSIVLGVIACYREPTLAKGILDTLGAKKKNYAHFIYGPEAEYSHPMAVDKENWRLERVKAGCKNYARPLRRIAALPPVPKQLIDAELAKIPTPPKLPMTRRERTSAKVFEKLHKTEYF